MPFGSTVLYLEFILCFGHLSLASLWGVFANLSRVGEVSLQPNGRGVELVGAGPERLCHWTRNEVKEADCMWVESLAF